jgi:hypothetical protein
MTGGTGPGRRFDVVAAPEPAEQHSMPSGTWPARQCGHMARGARADREAGRLQEESAAARCGALLGAGGAV